MRIVAGYGIITKGGIEGDIDIKAGSTSGAEDSDLDIDGDKMREI